MRHYCDYVLLYFPLSILHIHVPGVENLQRQKRKTVTCSKLYTTQAIRIMMEGD